MWFEYGVILCGAFLGAVSSGSAGFAFALIGTAVWMHVLPPREVVSLVVLCSLLLNLALVWRLRRDIEPARLWPFLAGGFAGVPLGVAALSTVDTRWLRATVGALLVLYSLWRLARSVPPVLRLRAGPGRLLDVLIGMVGGFLGGATSLNGLVPTLWSGLRGWSKREQRGVFQPYILIIHVVTLGWLGGAGAVTRTTFVHFALSLPALAIGAFVGLRIYDLVEEPGFQRIVLGLFLLSGGTLLLRG